MKRRIVTALLVVVAVVAVPVAAVAAWVSQGVGHGTAGATYVAKAGTPTVTRSGSTAVISWPQGVLDSGVVATGYIVKRTAGRHHDDHLHRCRADAHLHGQRAGRRLLVVPRLLALPELDRRRQ